MTHSSQHLHYGDSHAYAGARRMDNHPADPHGHRRPDHAAHAQYAPAAVNPHHPQRREAPQRQPAPAQAAASNDYTFLHRGRQVRLGPVAFWTFVGTLVIMAGWTMVTATYFAFKDDVITRLIARQAELQYAYEDRIAEMRAQVDRVTSRQLLDQEQVEQKLEQISRRQATLESRAATLGNLVDPGTTGSIKTNGREDRRKPSPIGDNARLEPRGFSALIARFTGRNAGGGVNGALTRLQESLDRVENRQSISLANLEESYSAKARRIRNVLAEVGIGHKVAAPAGVGGPYIPVKGAIDNRAFDTQLRRVNLARSQLDQLSRTTTTVPLRQPLPGELAQSSGFGVRSDPFLRRPAMHTGLDFRSETGEPVRATAAGTVTAAGWSGGYGKMVEIEHGHGLATRYGHLSEIGVREGQSIKLGQVIGRVGSTGRSTGPHLHYETRIGGEPVDPTRFLRAGSKLGLATLPEK